MPYSDIEDKNAWSRRYRVRNTAVVDAIKRGWQERNPEKRAAHVAVGNAVRSGKLVKGPCEFEDENCTPGGRVQAHHDDYARPLDVRWFCPWHHKRVDRGEM